MNQDNLIFALDIGTRTVVGVVGYEKDFKFEVIAYEMLEHKSRCMYDGQVHDIDKVASVVIDVKKKLEKKLGLTLKKVAIAAAGRALKTKMIKFHKDFDSTLEIDNEIISSLEMEGIDLAKKSLSKELGEDEKTTYYCVGYSIINYYINDFAISSLLGHKAKSIGADILATFLPQTVVESLYAVVKRAELEVCNLTLEPIAAINVAIPKDLRMLNLCLIDIGAGTSDIAITKNGAVIAYAMVPVAGDEITEAICENCLVDFNTAEKIKVSLSNKKEISYTDIMGLSYVKKADEIKEIIKPSIEYLAESICNKIKEYNEKSPAAIFLIGGGSKIQGLDKLIAQKLNMMPERVAVRGSEVIKDIRFKGKKALGPESITPLGIAITALMQRGSDFVFVNVNGKRIKIFNSRSLTVSDALLLSGFTADEIIARSGKNLKFILNGHSKTILGEIGRPSQIYVNGEIANLKKEINNGDDIIIKTAQKGKDAFLTVGDLVKEYGYDNVIVTVNGYDISKDYVIKDNDDVVVKIKEESLDDKEVAATKEIEKGIKVIVNGQTITLNDKKDSYIFVEIFNYIDFDISKVKGSVVLKLNGKDASYTDMLKDGDRIDIYCE